MQPTRILALLLGAVTLAAAAPRAEAGRYYVRPARPQYHVGVAVYPSGLYVGAGLVATRILDQSGGAELLENGGGLTLFTGIRISRPLALELGYLGSLHNPEKVRTTWGDDVDYLVLNGFTADARIFLGGNDDPEGPRSGQVHPFLQGGVGLYFLDSTYFGTQSVGSGFQLGGGIDVTLAPNISLGLRGLYRGISMGPPERAENNTFISALTAEANLEIGF
jgi:outer membrane protein with beta-barrel domain